MRRRSCSKSLFRWWFGKYTPYFANRDARTIDDVDEMHCDTHKRLRVIAAAGKMPLVEAIGKLPHVTSVGTICAAGFARQTLFIIGKLRNAGELAQYAGRCHLASTASGWMTKEMWLGYCFLYVSEMSVHRLSFDFDPRRGNLLISDGHGSRLNFAAAWLLAQFQVDLLILLPHTTHVAAPIDRAVAGPTKATLKAQFTKRAGELAAMRGQRGRAKLVRLITLESFINAFQRGAAADNIQAGFRATGLYPANVAAVLKSQFVTDDEPEYDPEMGEGMLEGNYLLTSPEGLDWLARREGYGDAAEAAASFGGKVGALFRRFTQCDPKQAHFLTPCPSVMWHGRLQTWDDIAAQEEAEARGEEEDEEEESDS